MRFQFREWLTVATTVGLLWLILWPGPAAGVILFGTSDPNANVTEPMGVLSGSGWHYQGFWGAVLGTPIGERYFITAGHVGGGIGEKFTFQGREFTTSAKFDDPNSDLRIWRICETFPIFAPLYEDANELGKSFVVFGRGTLRGEAVTSGGGLRGWNWGGRDGQMRWGENTISEILDASEIGEDLPGVGLTNFLKATFDADAGPNEAHLSALDSGGAIFIKHETGPWRLAGISFAAEAHYNTSSNGPGFFAALFDSRGFYEEEADDDNNDDWTFIPDSGAPKPGAFYATRISTSLAWIQGVLGGSIMAMPTLQFASIPEGPFEDDPTATVEAESKRIIVPRPTETRFYRLRGCSEHEILSARVEGETLILRYRSR